MPIIFHSLTVQLLLLWLMALLPVASSAAEKEKQQLQDLRGEMQHVQAGLKKKQQQRSEVQKELMRTEKEIGRQNREMRKLDRDIAAQQKRIRATKIQQELNKNSLESQSSFMQKQIRLAYTMGRQDRLKLLLNQRDPEMVGRLMVYHDYFNRRRTEQMDLIQTTLNNLKQAEQVMLAEERKMQQLQSRKKRERGALEKNLNGRKELIVSLSRGITSDAERLKELKRDEERLQKLLTEIQQKAKASKQNRYLAKGRPFKSGKGKMPWPAKGKLKARFGSAKRGGLKWDGILIGAPEGREVKAVHAGKVVFADWLRGFGLMLILDHGGGYMTLYGHNQSLAKQQGELVNAEEVIAALGRSGGQAEPGVYFAMRYKGQPIDPEKWFR
jgi:septal ring factor EnvC (AmiA/AmiB activator)